MYKLVISDDEGKTIIVPLVRDLITVGRQEGNTIRLTERNVSRQHARLSRGPNGYSIEDLDSYNGVTVNGVRIERTGELKDGDRVGIGDYVMALKVEAAVEPPRPAQPARGAAPQGVPIGPPARLVMISAPAPGAEFSIAKSHVRIGRLEELDLCISHRSISREHARILCRDGSFEIEDLKSANGVRVNGSATARAPLRSGDVVELGQVRFRFVGPGESYTFSGTEEQAAPVSLPRSGPSRATMVAVVSGAAVLGGALALLDRGEPQTPALAADAREGQAPAGHIAAAPAAPSAPSADVIARARASCNNALSAGSAESALRAASEGLLLAPSDGELVACQRRAEGEARVQRAFEDGVKAMNDGRLEDAFFLIEGIPDESVYRSRPEVAELTQRLAEARLARARSVASSDPSEAQRLALSVVQLRGAAHGVLEEAQHLLASGQPVRKASAAPPTAGAAAVRTAKQPVEAAAPAESPSKTARSCLAKGDQRCVIRALEGHTDSEQDLALLIETYRALGETKKAVRHMDSFVSRYPDAKQAPQYRQLIAKYEAQ
jgi:ABC transport system ATP-binding/permease protein